MNAKGGPEAALAKSSHRQATDGPTVAATRLDLDDLLSGREQAIGNLDPWWVDGAMRALKDYARTGEVFAADDLQERYGLPDPEHSSRQAARHDLIVPVGARRSRRPGRRAPLVRTWRGSGGDAA
jgi:hypothetical protein